MRAHLPTRDKAQELSDWIHQLESEKFDLMEKLKQQRYEVRCVSVAGARVGQPVPHCRSISFPPPSTDQRAV